MSEDVGRLAQSKLILLYLVKKMGIALSNAEICQFALEKEYMDYFQVQQYLSELVEATWLEKNRENHNTRYLLTEGGEEVLNYFLQRVPESTKQEIHAYIRENSRRIRAQYEVTANYFLEINNEYLVKCGLYDGDGSHLMEVSVSVVTKEQAQQICTNWRQNVSRLYPEVLATLASAPASEKEPEALNHPEQA